MDVIGVGMNTYLSIYIPYYEREMYVFKQITDLKNVNDVFTLKPLDLNSLSLI